jgi:hypothetical protein
VLGVKGSYVSVLYLHLPPVRATGAGLKCISAGQKEFLLAFSLQIVGSCQEVSRPCQGAGCAVSAVRFVVLWGPPGSRRESDIMKRLGPGIRAREKTHMPGLESLAFRFLVAVDVAGFSQRYAAEQARAQDDLEMAMTQAAASAGLARGRWYRQPRGDGELAVLPQGVNGLSLVADYPGKLASSVADVNRGNRGPRLKLRLAIHHGAVAPGRFGPMALR